MTMTMYHSKSKSPPVIDGISAPLLPPCPKKSFRFFFCSPSNDDRSKTFVVDVSSDDLKLLGNVEVGRYIPHDHRNPSRDGIFRDISTAYRSLYSATDDDSMFISWPVAIGSSVYMLFQSSGYDRSFWFRSINLDTGSIKELPRCNDRLSPKALDLRGQLYFLGGFRHKSDKHNFGEVFDPATNTWSDLTQPPNAAHLSYLRRFFAASLGDKEGKILVYCHCGSIPVPTILIYDVDTKEWATHPCQGLIPDSLEYINTIGEEVINETDGYLYWFSENCCIHALDWKLMRLYYGPVIGLDGEGEFFHLKDHLYGITFHHLWADVFCLVWCQVTPHGSSRTTEYHFTFLRVIKNPIRETLTAFVVGCFTDKFDHGCPFYQATLA